MAPPPVITKVLTNPDGTTVYAEAAGDPSKHPIVFIHGLGLLGTGWGPQFKDPQLYENFYLVRYDMRGHGRSSKSFEFKDYESIRYAEEFKTVCDAFGVVKPSVVVWYVCRLGIDVNIWSDASLRHLAGVLAVSISICRAAHRAAF